MAQLAIKRTIERVPGGMMIVPLFTGAIIRTLFPDIPKTFGSFTGALFTGALPILAVFYVCMGATIEFKATAYDGLLRSADSVTCEFNYDPTTPAAPSISSTAYPPAASGTGDAAGTTGAFTLSAASGVSVTHFVYRLDYVPPSSRSSTTATAGSTRSPRG